MNRRFCRHAVVTMMNRGRDLSILARLPPIFITHRTRDTMIHHGWRGHAMMRYKNYIQI